MKLTFLGHAGVRLQHAGHEVLVDPFLTGNPLAVTDPGTLVPGHIVLTHAHGDHVGDTVAIAKRCGATVIAAVEVVNRLAEEGVEGVGMNVGGGSDFPFGRLTFTPAWHTSSFSDGSYGGTPMGVVLRIGGVTVFHAGDTALFSDLALVARHGIDLALLPIGDHFTMGPDDALEAVRLLRPTHVVPMHYDTFPPIVQDAAAFAERVRSETEATPHVLAAGQSLEL
ncbi:MAG: metal-dependent hydrolase [Nocardiopsis sp. BM-2018]|nr:MAG: metal-dependent hydrolase [Nocardiopsis sp. BM-2018]